LTIRIDGKDTKEVTLPRWYLDGRSRGERNRRVDLAYATTGHRAQSLTRWRALVRLTGQEDANWLYVQLSRARHETTLYPVVGPEPQGPAELDLPDREPGDGYAQLAQALTRAGDQTLAIDTPSSLDLRRLSTAELREERNRLRTLLDQAPRDRGRELARASARRAEADQALAQLTTTHDPQRQAPRMLRLPGRDGPAPTDRAAALLAGQQANRAAEAELQLRRHQQRRAGWLEANADLGPAYRQVVREMAWQRRAAGVAAEQEPPAWLRAELGPVPASTRGRRAWRHAAAAITDYRYAYGISDPRAGPRPSAAEAGPAGRLATRPHGRAAGPGPPADHQPPGADRDDQPGPDRPRPARPTTRPEQAPARARAGRRLAPSRGGHHAQPPPPATRP
jgi:hypothetical protein